MRVHFEDKALLHYGLVCLLYLVGPAVLASQVSVQIRQVAPFVV